ncbi:cell division protein FtsA [uncultured Capnocytophaga sp.]|jgi:cell division protein ftsA|uniref:cell division protein FtsA n=1 Tax=uncultured Capnocytophaga sp. TaxID=159273 RepID=UPI00261F5921|nr:cell division protein FtsA [uncultured Capnocytophaga sp.]
MKYKNYYIGLDIGTTKIVAMVGVKNEYGKIQILGYGQAKSEGINKGVVTNIAQTSRSIMDAVQDAKEKTGLEIENVVAGIAGQNIISSSHSDYLLREDPNKLIDFEDLERLKERVNSISLSPGQEIIHALPQDYKVDNNDVKEPIGMMGSRLDAAFHLVIGQGSAIGAISRSVMMAHLKPKALTLEPIASASAVLSDEEKEAGVVLVDIGGGTTDVAIFKDGIIRHTAVVPLGGNVITEDIKEGCGILARQAEMLKVQYGSAWPGENRDNEIVSIPGIRGKEPREISLKNLSKIIHARVSEIINLVFNVIKSYGHEEPKKKLISGIVLTGGGSQLKHIVQLVEYITGMDTRIGYPDEHLASNSDNRLTSPIYATAIGLVMSAIENEAQEQFKKRLEELKAQEVGIPKNTENTLSQEKTIAPVDQNITIVDPITTTDQEELQPIDDNEEGKTKASENFLAKLNKFLSKYIGETDDE